MFLCRVVGYRPFFYAPGRSDQRAWDTPMWTADLADSGHNFLHNAPQGFSVLPSRLASLALVERTGADGVQETTGWSPPDRGSHSPRVLTPTRNRRRILEPISSPVHRADPRGVTPSHKESSSGGRLRMPAIASPPSQERLWDSGATATATNIEQDRTQIQEHREVTTVRHVNGNTADTTRPKFRRRSKVPIHERRATVPDGNHLYHLNATTIPYHYQDEISLEKETYYRQSPGRKMPNSGQMNPTSPAVCSIPQRPLLARRDNGNGARPDSGRLGSPPSMEQGMPPVDTTSPHKQSTDDLDFTSVVDEEVVRLPNVAEEKVNKEAEERERAKKYMKLKENQEEFASGPSSAGSVDIPDVVEITEVKEVTECVKVAETAAPVDQQPTEGSTMPINEPQHDVATAGAPGVPRQPVRVSKRTIVSKPPVRSRPNIPVRGRATDTCSKTRVYPDTLKPLEKPKESLNQYFQQMEQQEWEMTMQGLTLLVRLVRHHPDVAMVQLHSIVVSVVQQVRNLRSQVARAACQACGELFIAFKRGLDHELDDLMGALMNRTADTNKFLRADSNAALDLMQEHCSPMKILQIVVMKGASHQNAVVRAVAARLLGEINSKLGPEKVLALPREIRDKILLTGANFLMEGSLESRNRGKDFFRTLVKQPNFSKILMEAIPQYVHRNIEKTLKNL